MGVGFSDGKSFADMGEMLANSMSGDFQSRFGAAMNAPKGDLTEDSLLSSTMPKTSILGTVADSARSILSSMPLGGSTEPAGALKSPEGTQTPGKGDLPDWSRYNQPFGELKDTNPAGATVVTIPIAKQLGLEGADVTERDINKGIDIGLSTGPGTLAGVRSATFGTKAADLVKAHIMESNGTHPDGIWKATGLGRGADGRWRYEIDDSKMKFNKDWAANPTTEEQSLGVLSRPLTDVIDHPELFKAYPALKDVNVQYNHKNLTSGASYNTTSRTIKMNRGSWSNEGTLMHEVQHAIQDIEGFATGGSPGKAGSTYNLKLADAIKPYAQRLNELWNKSTEKGLSDEEWKEIIHLRTIANKFNEYAKAGDNKAFDHYMALSGETEARNVNTRLLLTEAERRRMPPAWTEDTPRSKQTVNYDPIHTSPYDTKSQGRTSSSDK